MAYTSIYAGGNFAPTLKMPIKYVAPPTTPKFNLGAVNDVPTLNKALRGGQISTQQWNQRFQQLQKPAPTIKTGILQNLNPVDSQSVLYKQNIQPVIDAGVGSAKQVKSQTLHLAGPTSNQAQRDTIINNQRALQAQANPQFNTKNPTGGNLLTRARNDVVSAYQHANPFSGVHDANKLISQTGQKYGFTPNFIKTLHNANTSTTNKSLMNSTAQAITELPGKNPSVINRTQINTTPQKGAPKGALNNLGGTPSSVLVHEGLHQVWAANPSSHQAFGQAYNQAAAQDKGLQAYLNAALNVNGKTQLADFSKMPPALQDEVHSATATYYLNQQKIGSANPLNKYYSQFLNLSQGYDNYDKPGTKGTTVSPVVNVINQSAKQGNSAQALIKAEAMAKQGTPLPAIQAFLARDRQALGAQTGRGIEAAATIAGFSAPGEGIISKVAAKTGLSDALGVARGRVTAAVGKDEATNGLIDTQRAQKALKQARTTGLAGKTAVDETKTQRIPVVSPTETSATRKSVGSTAIQNADRTSIPVKGESSQTVGKVTAPPKNYVKQSDALSKAYEKESAGLQNVASPHAQQVLQDKIDLKYGKLQQDLDTAHGQTSVNFKGKTTKVGQTGPALPRSALDSHPRYQPNESPVTTSTPETKSITVSTSKAAETAPKTVTEPATGANVAGSSLRTQAKAVEAGMKSEAESTGATYNTVSHKEEAMKAAQLVEENPTKARSIAMGARGDNASHEAAVYHAVANKAIEDAKKTGDYSEVTALANSPRHTGVSEAAQKLGAEGYNANPHDPINIMNDLAKTREAAVTKRAGKPSVAKATTEIKKEVKAVTPKVSRQDWHSFIQELQCK